MAVRRPRKPRTPTPQGGMRPVLRGAESAMSMVDRLSRQYQQTQREATAARARAAAAAPPARSRRVPTSEDTFLSPSAADEPVGLPGRPMMPWINLEEYDRPAATTRPVMPWLSDPSEARMPGDEIGGYDDGTGPPDDGSGDGGGDDGSSREWYSPTRSIYPPRPRTLEMSYDRQTRVLRVVYRDGGTYDYFNVPGSVWYRIRQVKSPGRFINRNILDQYAYEKVAF